MKTELVQSEGTVHELPSEGMIHMQAGRVTTAGVCTDILPSKRRAPAPSRVLVNKCRVAESDACGLHFKHKEGCAEQRGREWVVRGWLEGVSRQRAKVWRDRNQSIQSQWGAASNYNADARHSADWQWPQREEVLPHRWCVNKRVMQRHTRAQQHSVGH